VLVTSLPHTALISLNCLDSRHLGITIYGIASTSDIFFSRPQKQSIELSSEPRMTRDAWQSSRPSTPTVNNISF